MPPGAEIVASSRLYGGSLQQMRNTYPEVRLERRSSSTPTIPRISSAPSRPNTKAFFIESLANPGGVISDIEAIARIAEAAGVPLLVDNTLATPFLCKPIDYGATLIVHSTTKFLSGTGTSMGGAVVNSGKFDWAQGGKFPSLAGPEPAYHGLNFFETFGDMAYTFHSHAVGLRDLGPEPGAVQRVAHHAGHRDAGAAHGAPLRQRAEGRRVSRQSSRRGLGELCRPAVEQVPCAGQEIPAARARARCSPSASRAATRWA